MKPGLRRYLVVLGLALAVVAGVSAAPSCYNPKLPQCGFICGPGGACPEDYACASDNRCHLNGSPSDLVCGPPLDAPIARPDAAIDAPIDAPIDADIDAPIDSPPD